MAEPCWSHYGDRVPVGLRWLLALFPYLSPHSLAAFPAGSDSSHGQALAVVATSIFSLASGISSPESHTACPMRVSCVGRDRAHPHCTLRGVRERGHPWGQRASGGLAYAMARARTQRDSVYPGGQRVSRGTACVHGDKLNPGGQRVSTGTVCVQRDSMYPSGQHVSMGTACVHRDKCVHGNSLNPRGQHVSVGDSLNPEGQRVSRGTTRIQGDSMYP